MWRRTFLRTWLGRRQGPTQTRKKIGARMPIKPMLEMLEDRLAPAFVSLASGVLDFTASSAAYNVAEQAYTSALATSNQDEITNAHAQQIVAVAEANATAASAASASAMSAASSPPLNASGPVTVSDQHGVSGLNWTNPITSTTSTVTEQSQSPLTISADITASGSIGLQAESSPATEDDLTVSSGVAQNIMSFSRFILQLASAHTDCGTDDEWDIVTRKDS